MSVYGLKEASSPKDDGHESVWKMTDEERTLYLEQKREQFLMSQRTIGTVLTDDQDLKEFTDCIKESGELLNGKQFKGLIKNIEQDKVQHIWGFDLSKFTVQEQKKLARGGHYLSWAMSNIDEAKAAEAQSKRNFEQIFKGDTTYDDYFPK